MSALKIKDAQGNWIEVPMIKGDKGDKGEQGDTYELTEQDKQDIADLIEVPEPLKYVKDDSSDNFSVIEGCVSGDDVNVATGAYSHAEGLATKALGYASHSEGNGTQAKNSYSHAEGYNNISSADYAHSEGVGNTASGTASHSEGNGNVVSGLNSHVEGVSNIVTGSASHAEGANNEATNYASHVEGQGNHATGYYSHSEGYGNRASGTSSHAEGEDTEVISGANASHVEGKGTLAITSYQHAQGKYNNPSYDYAFMIGNGSSKSNRSNAMTLDWNGNGVYAGKLTVGTAPTADMDVATKKYVDDVKGASIHICSSAEYDSTTRVPTIQNPDEKTFYLVPSEDGTSPDLFVEWAYVNNAWEMFGSASIDLSGYLTDVQVNGASVVTNGVAEVSIEDNGMVVTATLVSGTQYTIDSTYDAIKTALSAGKTVVVMAQGVPQPYVGNVQLYDAWYLAFGVSTVYNNIATLTGFMIPETDQNIAVWTQQNTTIPQLNDVQINGTSILDNGVANIPYADTLAQRGGLIATTPLWSGVKINNGALYLNPPASTDIKSGTDNSRTSLIYQQHESTFYGLAKAAGHDEKDSTLTVGNYTPEAKGAIQSMLGIDSLIAPTETNPFSEPHVIGDLFIINGTLYKAKTAIAVGDVLNDGVNVDGVSVDDVLSGYVKNTDYATANDYGVVKIKAGTSGGLQVGNGLLSIYSAGSSHIKVANNTNIPITPAYQHESVFYGLAKASGDTTQSQSDNAVGTYTDEAKSSIKSMLGIDSDLETKLDKPQGTVTTSTLVDTFSVTTAQEQDWNSPHALATPKSRIPKNARYIVTYNGTDYHLPCQLWGDNDNKVVEFLGNISLYADDTAGFNQTIYNVPFCIISDLNNASSIDVITSTAETATFKITKVLNNTDTIDEEYLYGSADAPFKYYDSGGSTYSKLSIGNANLVINRGGIAIGSNNKSSGDFAIAMGYGTWASGNESLSEGNCTLADGFASHAEGIETEASSNGSHAEGYRTEVTSEADYGHAEGSNTVVSGIGGHAEGYSTQAEGLFSHAEGFQTVANHFVQHVFGAFNIADASTTDSEEDGNYIEIVGNGNDGNSRSNARTLDWQGNERLKGSITLGADTANETSLSATELQGLKAIDVSNVVRTTDICTDNTMGIARTNSSFGITSASGSIRTSAADLGHIKTGTHGYKPITPMRQHEAVFYGLTKAAGVDMASSSNAVGTYTDEAKTAIKQMLGVVDSYDSLVVNVTGTDPVITAQPSYRYNCGEVTTLTITPPSSGTIDFIFTSGTTPTVLDLPSTVKMPSWWIGVEANTTYEMCITDGVYCGVMSWDV